MALTWPSGIRSSGVTCGIKPDGQLDLGILVLDRPGAWAGTFTKNAAAAAPVQWCRARRGDATRAIVVNSGNANACTGQAGELAVADTTGKAAAELGCDPTQILVASTGPIGLRLPAERICGAVPAALETLGPDGDFFAHAILTTDTRIKSASVRRDGFEIVGVAKGAAMLAPNMATMLAFIATDAALDAAALQTALVPAVRNSFDRISVDACESTNDSVFLVSSGTQDDVELDSLAGALESVCRDLAEQMVRDAEGGSKFVRVQIAGAATEGDGVALGRAVAASALWRAAMYGGDPNWGRVLAAVGATDRNLDLADVELRIGQETVFSGGGPVGSPAAAAAQMSGDELVVFCRVGPAATLVEVLTTDLSPDYVVLNATGTS